MSRRRDRNGKKQARPLSANRNRLPRVFRSKPSKPVSILTGFTHIPSPNRIRRAKRPNKLKPFNKKNRPAPQGKKNSLLNFSNVTLSLPLSLKSLVCVKRKLRREVLFAFNKTGMRGQKRPRFNSNSDIHCVR